MEVSSANTQIEEFCSTGIVNDRFAEPTSLEKEVTAWFDDLRAPLFRYLSSFGLVTHDAEEVIQEVFLSLFLHLRDGKPRSNIRGWIFRVAHNLGLKRRESNHRFLRLIVPDGDRSIDSHLDASPDPEEHVSSRQRSERLLAAVQNLPDQDRQCLYLRAEGFRYRAIAQVMGISVGGVALSLARTLARLSRADGK